MMHRAGTGDAQAFLTKMFDTCEQSWTLANLMSFEAERG